jgi:hypothetical protein
VVKRLYPPGPIDDLYALELIQRDVVMDIYLGETLYMAHKSGRVTMVDLSEVMGSAELQGAGTLWRQRMSRIRSPEEAIETTPQKQGGQIVRRKEAGKPSIQYLVEPVAPTAKLSLSDTPAEKLPH